MKQIEIVVHCYAVKSNWYASLLHYQLGSLVSNPGSNHHATVAVCYDRTDEAVCAVLKCFSNSQVIKLKYIEMDKERLGRRAIGRNLAAKATKADIVWFADADYLFGEDCLSTLANWRWPDDASLAFPKHVNLQLKESIDVSDLECVNDYSAPKQWIFSRHTFVRPIGGIQIVKGDFAREYGYCANHPIFQSPHPDPFKLFRSPCDKEFRRGCKRHGKQAGVDLPNLYRLGHPRRDGR